LAPQFGVSAHSYMPQGLGKNLYPDLSER